MKVVDFAANFDLSACVYVGGFILGVDDALWTVYILGVGFSMSLPTICPRKQRFYRLNDTLKYTVPVEVY